jgi:hypothetical protein
MANVTEVLTVLSGTKPPYVMLRKLSDVVLRSQRIGDQLNLRDKLFLKRLVQRVRRLAWRTRGMVSNGRAVERSQMT